LSLTLCLCICLGVVFSATACGSDEGSKNNTTSNSKVPTTISFLGITSEETELDNIEMVEEALNEIFTARFKTKIDLTLVTAEKYMDIIKERIELAEEYARYDAAVGQYNTYIKKQANTTSANTDKIFGNWISGNNVKVTLETLATRLKYVSEQTTVLEDGRVETLYPEAPSPIDIVMIVDEKMYDDFTAMGLLEQKSFESTNTSYKNLQKYIYPTFFSELKNLKKYVNAVPNNNMLATSTYLVVNKELADKYDFDIEAFKNYSDLAGFLANVKKNENIVPFKDVPEALGVFQLFSDDVAIGAYLPPLLGYNPEEGADKIEIKNLFEIKEYTDHLILMEEYQKLGYFDRTDVAGNGFAVQVVEGDASILDRYDPEKYEVKEIQIPFVLREAIFNGMLAPTVYTSDLNRSLEIIEAINTDPQVKNLLQYGIEGYNYMPNKETGSIIPLNGSYVMDNALTGNVYMGYIPYEPEAETTIAWSYVMQTNLAAVSSPFLLFPVDEAYLQENLAGILKRAGLAEALSEIDITYDKYANPASTSMGTKYQNQLREAYTDYLIDQALEQGKVDKDDANARENAAKFVKSAAMDWVEETIAAKYINNKIATLGEIETLVGEKLAGTLLKNNYEDYIKARESAQDYLNNIANLRVIAKVMFFADMSQEAYDAKYGVMGALEFEQAIYDYIKANYEKENNLTAADYEKLVQDYIAANFKFTDKATNQQYTYTWDEFLAIKENAKKFSTPLAAAKAEYKELIKRVGGASDEAIDAWSDTALAEAILETIRTDFYNSLNTSDDEFYTTMYNDYILAPFNITKRELDVLKVKDNALYKDYLAKVKKQYKNELLETYTKDEYAAMKDTDALQAVLNYYVEAFTQANAKLCASMGLTKEQYKEYYEYAKNYISCVDKIKKSFTYTLRTRYTTEEINAMSTVVAEEAVYNLVYESGYFMNELAKCIGTDLSSYNDKKSQAIAYLGDSKDLAYKPGYLADVIRAYEVDLQQKGYTLAQARAMDPADIEAIIMDIIREKYFSDYRTLDVELINICKDYFKPVEDSFIDSTEAFEDNGVKVDSMEKYVVNTASKLSGNFLYEAIVGYLNDALQAKLAK
jgi:hypothetical protein